MITVTAVLAPGLTRIEVTGHQDHGTEHVCAAVSAITQTALLGLEHVAATHPDLVQVEITEE